MTTIQEYLGVPANWPIVENIKHEIVLVPTKADVKRAKRKDPRGCALRNAACRMYDIPDAAIGSGSAYIPQRDSKGKMYIARVLPTKETRAAIRRFDETGEMPEAGFRFIAPSASTTVKALRKAHFLRAKPSKSTGTKPRRMKKMRVATRTLWNGLRYA